jgi:hypothetical protein
MLLPRVQILNVVQGKKKKKPFFKKRKKKKKKPFDCIRGRWFVDLTIF